MVAGVARRGAARCGSARRDATRRNSRSLSASLSACIRISGWWRQERWKGQRQQLSVAVDGNGAGWRSALGESRAYLLEGSATTNSVYCCWCCRWCCWWCCCWPYACWSVVSVVFSSVHSVVGLASSPRVARSLGCTTIRRVAVGLRSRVVARLVSSLPRATRQPECLSSILPVSPPVLCSKLKLLRVPRVS